MCYLLFIFWKLFRIVDAYFIILSTILDTASSVFPELLSVRARQIDVVMGREKGIGKWVSPRKDGGLHARKKARITRGIT